jgi:hypothetical protein
MASLVRRNHFPAIRTFNPKGESIMKVTTEYVTCDLCQEVDSSTISFGIMGADYRIDLCETHMGELKAIFGVYVTAGHKVRPAPMSIRRDMPKPKVETEPSKRKHRKTKEKAEVADNGA